MNFSNRTRKALQLCLSLSTLSLPSSDMCPSPHRWEVIILVSILGLGSWQDLPGKAVCHCGALEKKIMSHHCN
uniref:Uncharacterized protein n=1 Tax=Nomascus leucogenys TaxID=61853 RepID=A0A2I3H4M8_NOMLE